MTNDRAKRRMTWLRENLPSRVTLFERVDNGTAGRADAIKAFCLECNGLEAAGVKTCGDRACPLWNFRPFQTGDDTPENSGTYDARNAFDGPDHIQTSPDKQNAVETQ